MQISYAKLFNKLKADGITQKVFKEKSGVSSGSLAKMLHNDSITTDTICKICDFFQCMPDEIMEWIPDADYEEKRKQKEKVEARILELQKEIEKLQK